MTLDPKTGLLGWWKLEEASGTARVDSSGQAHTLTENPNGVVNSTSLKREGAASVGPFATDCLRRTDGNLVSGFPGKFTGPTTSAFTVAAWIHPLAGAGSDVCFGKNGAYDLIYNHATTRFNARMNASSIAANLTNATGRWWPVAIRWDGGEFSLWIDGAKQTAVAALSSLTHVSADFIIGAELNDGTNFLNGHVDDLAIWNRALSDTEMAIVTMVGPTNLFLPANKLVGAWMMEEAAGNQRIDWSPALCHMNESASLPRSTAIVKQGSGAAGKFSTTPACLNVADANLPGAYPWRNGTVNNEWTFGAWFHPAALATSVAWRKGVAVDLRWYHPAPQLWALVYNTSNTLTNGVQYPANEWRHLAFRYRGEDDDELSMFVDGVKQPGAATVASIPGVTGELILGASTVAHASPFDGYMDEAWVFARALASVEIQQIVQQGLESFSVPVYSDGTQQFPGKGKRPPRPALGYPRRGQRSGGSGGGGRRGGSGARW